jgi:O-antigen/teichoic acid export membrane protein
VEEVLLLDEERSLARKSPSIRARLTTWFSPNNLSRRASLTSLASSLDYIAGITVQFVINPLLLQGLGSSLYGAWRVLYSLNGYLWATGGRSAQALTWVIAHGQRSFSDDDKRRYVGSAVVVWFIFLPLLLIVGSVGSWFAPYFLETAPEHVWAVRAAAALLAGDAIALTLLSIPRSTLQGENLGYKRLGLSAILIALGGVFMALAIHWNTGIGGVAAANMAGTIVTGLLFWRVARKHVPWFGIARPTRQNMRWFLGLSGWFTGWKFVYELMSAGDVIVLGLAGSVELVTVYTLTKFVTQALIPLIGMVFEGTAPGLGAIIGNGETLRGARLRSEIMAFTWLLCTVLGASLLLWNPSFVALWVGPRFYAGTIPMLLIVVMVVQFIFVGNDARIIDLTLNLRAKVLLGAASAVLSVALGAFLVATGDSDISGMCIGIIVGRTVLSVAYPWLLGRALAHPLTSQLRGLPRPAMTTAVLFSAAMWLGERVATSSWIALIAAAGATALALVPVAAVVGLTAGQRRALLGRFRKVVRGEQVER